MNFLTTIIIAGQLIGSAPVDWGNDGAQLAPPISGARYFSPDDWSHAGPVRDRVGANLLVSNDERNRHQNETSVFINPSDPHHILGGCNDYRGADVRCGWYVSFDGGRTWEDGVVDGLDEFDGSGDPSVVINRDGTAWFCGIHFNRNNDDNGIFVSRSDDGGLNWEDPNYVIVHRGGGNAPGEDKPYLAIDNTGGDFDGRLYVSWTKLPAFNIYFSFSEDDGENWTEPNRIYAGRGQGSVPVVGPDGELYVIWKDYSDDLMLGKRSDDGGESFGDLFVVARTDQLPNALEPTEFRVNSIPGPAVDHSDSERRGRIYVSWADERFGDADILMTWSDDGGEDWENPIRLNDDERENDLDQFFPWVSVDPVTGELYAMWCDRRLDEDNIMVDVYGVRWSGEGDLPGNERITSESFDPRIGFNGAFMGDYHGVAALNGRAHPAWCDTRDENQSIYYAPFEGEQHFFPMPGERNHAFTIQNLTIDGEHPEAGDEIAVLDGDYRVVGSLVIDGDAPYEVTATGEWRSDIMHWNLWDSGEERELIAAHLPLDGEEILTHDGETTLRLMAPPSTQEIRLMQGWNMFSVNHYPVSLDPHELVVPIVNLIELMKDESGRFYTPEHNFSNLRRFDPLEGYQIKVREETVLEAAGYPQNPQTPVPLIPGWNMAAYLPDYDLDPWNAFDAIIDDVELAKDDRGRFMSPPNDFSNMIDLTPGEGYHIKIAGDREVELIYPEEPEGRLQAKTIPQLPEHFTEPEATSNNMSVLIRAIHGLDIEHNALLLGGEVAIVNAAGDVCGAVHLTGPAPWGVAVWGIDPESPGVGMAAGEELQFKLWLEAENCEYDLKPESNTNPTCYAQDKLAVVGLVPGNPVDASPRVISLLDVQPNPFNNRAVVEFRVSEGTRGRIDLFNLQGRLAQTVSEGYFSAGVNRIELNAGNLPTGIYLLQASTGVSAIMERIILLR